MHKGQNGNVDTSAAAAEYMGCESSPCSLHVLRMYLCMVVKCLNVIRGGGYPP